MSIPGVTCGYVDSIPDVPHVPVFGEQTVYLYSVIRDTGII
jgi:hypothetical protein